MGTIEKGAYLIYKSLALEEIRHALHINSPPGYVFSYRLVTYGITVTLGDIFVSFSALIIDVKGIMSDPQFTKRNTSSLVSDLPQQMFISVWKQMYVYGYEI